MPATLRNPAVFAVLTALAAAAFPARAQLTSTECPAALSASDFQAAELFNRNGTAGAAKDSTLSEPTHMDVRTVFKADGSYDHSDIVFVERTGNVKWFDGAAKKVSRIGHISVHAQGGSEDDNGLMGVAFDPGFETNRWIYLWYSPSQTFDQSMTGSGQNRQLRLSRFALKADNALDTASEKILIKILGSKTDQWHSGGPMTFDAYGDLWLAIGNNTRDLDPAACDAGNNVLSKTDSSTSAEWGPSDTHSMRGGFIRIHPDTSARGYSIPRGNFGEYWADKFAQQGNTALAAQYRDPSKVLPEVYVKGERSNFSCAVHPTKRWLAWGTVNYNSNNDEFNITNHPIFSGFPYFMANNAPTCNHGKSATAPTNTNPMNGGVTTLPPAIPGTLNNLVNIAIGGPIYSFDRSQPYKGKFPPHFDDKWIVAGFRGGMWAVTVDTTKDPFTAKNTTKLDGSGNLFANVPIRNHIQSMYGKEGALYILNYDGYYNSAINPGVTRVTYAGTCQIVSLKRPRAQAAPYQRIRFDATRIAIGEKGPHRAALFDTHGRRVWVRQGAGPRDYPLAEIRERHALEPGVYLVRVRTPAGESSGRISLY